jgi:hypothetical protein
MKKILIIVGLAFGCSAVYAQTVTQIGVGNSNMINGASLTNPLSSLTLTQLYGNTAEGTQGPDLLSPGGEIRATIRQRNIGATAPALYNFIRIVQEGAGHDIFADQVGYNNRASIRQTATATNAFAQTSQFGYNNGIILRQTGGADYTATIRQGGVIPGGTFPNLPASNFPTTNPALSNTIKNTATLDQVGEAGAADIVQAGSSSRFTGIQKGGTPLAPNTILIRQDNMAAIDLDQDGESSNIEIRQDGWQYARATQGELTVRNNIVINQGVNRLQDTKNTAVVTQNQGDSNQATVNQNTTRSEKNDTRIVQNGSRRNAGNNSVITVDQEGKSSRTILTQTETSRGSEIDVLQTGSEVFKGSYAEITQGGEDNVFNVEQDGNLQVVMGTQEGEDNRTLVDQEGNKNMATVNQDGSDNEIDIFQDNEPSAPVGNKATANQAAGTSDSDITINQNFGDGDNNVAVVNQNRGDDNEATILQNQDNVAIVTQNGTEAQPNGEASIVNIDQSESTGGEATVTQANGTFGNRVDIDQNQEGNTATVNQTNGRLNEATINQDDDGNTATINQSGTENGDASGDVSTVSIDQNEKNAVATVTQSANGSDVSIDQDMEDVATVNQLGGYDNDVTITQQGETGGGGNTATVTQTGHDNDFTIDQEATDGFDGNVVMGTQGGVDNTVDVTQDGPANMATVDQQGNDNEITIDQESQSLGGNTATATQSATTSDSDITITQNIDDDGGNTATVNQTTGDDNEATVEQLKDNTALVTQSGTADAVSGTGSDVNIDQSASIGGNATASQSVGTFGGTINITQVEEGNTATVNQTSGRRNLATVNQTDDGNTATVNQSGTQDASTGNISEVQIDQEGKNGVASVTQSANGSIVNVLQTNGDGNRATVQSQMGRVNDIGIEQYGDENTATVTQSGQENMVRTLQTNIFDLTGPDNGPASHEATVVQGGTLNDAVIGQGGLNNAATISQGTGQTQFASTLQYGERNTATTTQNGAGPTNTVNIVQSQIPNAGGPAGAILGSRASRNAETVAAALRANAAAAVAGGFIGEVQDNTARVSQTAGTVTNQSVELYQTGNEGSAIISQGGTVGNNTFLGVQAGESDELTSAQTGASGDVEINQYGTPNSIGNVATSTQMGTNNEILVNQVKFGNTAIINQSGNDHNAALAGAVGVNITQIGENNTADVAQSGNRNSTAVIQGDATLPVAFGGFTNASVGNVPDDDAFRNGAGVTQTGLDNSVGIVQQGDDGTATVNQAGNDNTIGIRQLNPGAGPLRAVFNVATASQSAGVANSIIDIEQFGRRNNGSATQSGTGVNNTINLNQRNDDNVAILSQTQGNQNVISVRQTPDAGKLGGRVEIAQVGQDNKARVEQSGYENTLTLTQTGDRNVLQQNGANPFALQGGHNNTATLMQTGQDHTINLNQSGMNNTIMVTQANL